MRKNKSKNVKDGTIVYTNDRNLLSGRNYKGKPHEDPKKNNRPTVVVASNRKDELAIVKITHSNRGKKFQDGFGKDKNSGIRANVEIKDNNSKPIRISKKFQVKGNKALSSRDFEMVVKDVFVNSKLAKQNRRRARAIKGRKPP